MKIAIVVPMAEEAELAKGNGKFNPLNKSLLDWFTLSFVPGSGGIDKFMPGKGGI